MRNIPAGLANDNNYSQKIVTSLNNDLYQIDKWPFQWKMTFNPDPGKQAQEIIFRRKTKKISHPSLRFNNNIVSQTPY